MKIKDAVDTIESREKLISYFEWLQTEGKPIPDDMMNHITENIFSKASVVSLKRVLDKINNTLCDDVDRKVKTNKEAGKMYEEARDLAFKHCLILEVRHKHTKADSLKQDPAFAKIKFTGR
jgi:hypothetical protein